MSETPTGDAVKGAVEIGGNLANNVGAHDAAWILALGMVLVTLTLNAWMMRPKLRSIDNAVNGRRPGEPTLVAMVEETHALVLRLDERMSRLEEREARE